MSGLGIIEGISIPKSLSIISPPKPNSGISAW
jgi:hypothetical protein